MANLRFVVKVARRYRSSGLRMTDLIQEGNLGLIKAVKRFDPDKGLRLVSYAVWWIRSSIQSYTLKSYSLVRLGTTRAQRRLFFSLGRATRELRRPSGERGLVPEAGDEFARIAEKLCVKEIEVEEMHQRMGGRDVSLDAPMRDDIAATHLDLLADQGPSQDFELATAEVAAIVQSRVGEALARLRVRERHIIEERVMSDQPATLTELAKHFGISRERTRQLEQRAKLKLRRELVATAAEFDWPSAEKLPEDRGPWEAAAQGGPPSSRCG